MPQNPHPITVPRKNALGIVRRAVVHHHDLRRQRLR
jgi:hypothetical protein